MKNFFITSLALLAAISTAMPTSSPETNASEALAHLESRAATCSKASVDKLIFKASMSTFQKARKSKNPSKCNWASDGCSGGPEKIRGYNFLPSCQRHDFGYRNTKKQKRFTSAMKKRIDVKFKNDLYKYCAQYKGLKSWKGVECRRYADIYYVAVRKFGRRNLDMVTDEPITKRDVLTEESHEKRDEASDDGLEGFTGEELDADIEGQEIPELEDDDEE